MKKGITTLLILFATTVAAFSQSVESISYYEKNPSLGGDVKILKCTKSITEAQTFTTFEVEAPASGLHYANFWVLGTKKADGTLSVYKVMVNNELQDDVLAPVSNDWQAIGLKKSSKVFLRKGKNTISIVGTAPDVPEVEFVRLSKDLGNSTISSQNYNDYKVELKTLSHENALSNVEPSLNFCGRDTLAIPLFAKARSVSYDSPLYDFEYIRNCKIKYSFFKTVSFQRGQQIFIATNGIDNYDHVLELFSANNPERYTWNAHSNNQCLASLNVNIPETGLYYVRVRSWLNATSGLANVNINGENYYSNVPLFSLGIVCNQGTDQVYNTFVCSKGGDPMVWIESYGNPSGIIAYNDDYQGNGDFDWGRWARINKKYSVAGNAVLLSQYSSYQPEVLCNVYIKCKKSSVNNVTYAGSFPYLKEDDAIMSAPESRTYNCISWSGGITSYWEWPPSTHSNFYDPDPLRAFDKFYASRGLTRVGANAENGTVALWAIVRNGKREYTHASVRDGADGNLHGYDWESKPGALARTFHPRNGVRGNSYGEIVEYYRKDTSLGTKPQLSADAKVAQVSFTDLEQGLIESRIALLPAGTESKFKSLVALWDKDINQSPYSSFEQLGEYDSYRQLKSYCASVPSSQFLVYKELGEGNIFMTKLLEDLVPQIPTIKKETKFGAKPVLTAPVVITESELVSPYANTMLYVKGLLSGMDLTPVVQEDSANPTKNGSSFGVEVSGNTLSISYTLENDCQFSMTITDVYGHVVTSYKQNKYKGSYSYKATLPHSGTYVISYSENNKTKQQKIIVE